MAFGISGFLVQILTAPIAIAIDAVTYLASALLLGTIRQEEPPPPEPEDRDPVLTEIRVGLDIVRHSPILRAFVGAQMALAALWGVFGATFFLFVLEDLQLARPCSASSPASVARRRSSAPSSRHGPRRAGASGRWPSGRCSCRRSATRSSRSPRRACRSSRSPASSRQQLVADSAVTVYDITEVSVRQTLVHDRALGRVTSTFKVAAMLAQLVATIGAGFLAEAIGLRATAWLAPIGGLVAAAILWFSPVRQLLVLPPAVGDTPPFDPHAIAVAARWTSHPARRARRGQANSAATKASGSNGMRSPTASPTPT